MKTLSRALRIGALTILGTVAAAQEFYRFEKELKPPDRYQTGGALPLLPGLQEVLDRNAALVTLGINTDWLAVSAIRQDRFVEAIGIAADCVRANEFPGAVIYLNRVVGANFPVGVGYLLREPDRVMVQYASRYELGELSGAVGVVPLVLLGIERGELRLEQTLGELAPEVAGGGKAAITLEQLLRHRSGLPRKVNLPTPLPSRTEAVEILNNLRPVSSPGTATQFSRYNHLLLGIVLEHRYALPVTRLAEEELFQPFGMMNTTYRLPATWRAETAAGPIVNWRGHMAWGETTDALTAAFGESGGSGNLVSSADDLADFSSRLLGTGVLLEPLLTTATLAMIRVPNEDSERFGLGFGLGGFGAGSVGLDAAEGCSLWMLPEENAFLIFLSNFDHPKPPPMGARDPRTLLFPKLREALAEFPTPTPTP